jgi:hypothetical protein
MNKETKLFILRNDGDLLFELEDFEIYEFVKSGKLPKETLLFLKDRTQKRLNYIEKIIESYD